MKRILDSRIQTKIPTEETGGSPQFKRPRLEEPLEDEQGRTGEDETEPIDPENIPMTKNPEKPNSSTASSILDKRQCVIAKYHFIDYPRPMCPCTKKRNVFSGTEWVTHGSVKIHSPVEAAKICQRVPRERRLHSRFSDRNKNVGREWIGPVNPCP